MVSRLFTSTYELNTTFLKLPENAIEPAVAEVADPSRAEKRLKSTKRPRRHFQVIAHQSQILKELSSRGADKVRPDT